MATTTIELHAEFEAAHHLFNTENLLTKHSLSNHGHSYRTIATIQTDKLLDGHVADVSALKVVTEQLDHAQLLWCEDAAWLSFFNNQNPDMKIAILQAVPTTENIAEHLANKLIEALPLNAELISLALTAGKDNWATFTPSKPE